MLKIFQKGEKEIDYGPFFFFFSEAEVVDVVVVSSAFGSSFFSSISVVISSIGFGGGVVAIVQPIHAPMSRIAMNAMNTGTSTAYSRASLADICKLSAPVIQSGTITKNA